jgi:hypothetical protein
MNFSRVCFIKPVYHREGFPYFLEREGSVKNGSWYLMAAPCGCAKRGTEEYSKTNKKGNA